ncbi:hypothetical protein A6A19_01130 [Actinobacillus delphinicola]|uniref:McrB family protein n=1 Tax=Actinobacillus delphinicola TaxID=51161 RepID=UPI0024423056|nr:AAA family ATPase [Actinobacillus delphinicola]MDG6896632.1 hypothetical protein [Actinobacillus delphinicola]
MSDNQQNNKNQQSRLKNLYDYLMKDPKNWENWYKDYKELNEEVDKIRTQATTLSWENEKDNVFLKSLLFDDDNGISCRGQSVVAADDYEKVYDAIKHSLQDLIKCPTTEYKALEEKFNHFAVAWKAAKDKLHKNNNPLLINRTAAACTTSLCTLVKKADLDKLVNWLENEELIEKIDETNKESWFELNIELVKKVREIFKNDLDNNESNKIDEFLINIFLWRLYEYMDKPFTLSKQIIKYGPPGTGKTYQAKEDCFKFWQSETAWVTNFSLDNHLETVQFHPSYSYEDFMEGIRPTLDNGNIQLRLQNGIFKNLCKEAAKWEIDFYHLKQKHPDLSDWLEIKISDLKEYKNELSKKYWKFVFKNNDEKLVSEVIPSYFLIIDEINRAELSRVLGELMYCLEYRGTDGMISTQYATLNDENTGLLKVSNGYKFFIPHNIYIIGTMNTIDRSIESLDFALRRRFSFQEVLPDEKVLRDYLKTKNEDWQNLADNFTNLNKEIIVNPYLGKDYQIGHAYLMKLDRLSKMDVNEVRKYIWENSISPLLQEYLRSHAQQENDTLNKFKKAFGL